MGKKFFQGWQMWEKLCFVLACAIVVTILLGAVKLTHTQWRLRKYTAVAEKEKKEQAIQRQMSMRRRHDETPFGIRALESGVEVEGVWISSRPTTPDRNSRRSSAGSLALQHLPRRSGEEDIEKGFRRSHEQAFSPSTPTSAKAPSSGFERAVSAERLPSSHTSRDSSPDGAIAKPPRSMYPPCSYTKYHHHPYTQRYSNPAGSLEGLEAAQRASFEAIRRASTSINQDGNSGSDDSSNSANDMESIAASAPRLFTQPAPRQRHQSVDFEMMNNHRISQVAETGQLTPRTKKGSQSVDWSDIPLHFSTEYNDYFGGRQKPVSASSSEAGSSTNPFSTPKIDALPPAVRRSSMPNVTPFAQFCRTAPPSPQLESARSASQERASSQWRQSHALSMPKPAAPSPTALPPPAVLPAPIAPTSVSAPQQQVTQTKRPSFEKRASQVVRGHGSGFEILAPGSLNPPAPAEHPMERQRAAPPVSLHNVYPPRSSSAGPPGRRLQKKRRPSNESTTSSESGSGRSRNSVL